MFRVSSECVQTRVAKSARTYERGSSITKYLIDSEDPKHTLFCRETAFVVIYALLGIIFPSFDRNSNIFAISK